MSGTPNLALNAQRRILIRPTYGECELCFARPFDLDGEPMVQTLYFIVARRGMDDHQVGVDLCPACMQTLEDAAYIAVRTMRAREEVR